MVGRIHLDKRSKVPVQHQLKRHIQFLIFTGELSEGDRLPSHRDLAVSVGVNRNTVSQVYAELEQEGWLRGKHGSGTFVHASSHIPDQDLIPLHHILNEAVERAAAAGFTERDLLLTLQGRLRMRAVEEEEDGGGGGYPPGRKVADRSYL